MNLMRRLILQPLKITIKDYNSRRRKQALFADLAPLVPPLNTMFDGAQDYDAFKSNGEEFFRIYREVCGLRPDERMLDVGSGVGRKTLPLTRYFDERATYEGIDITQAGIDWCRAKITPRFPRFRFRHVNVYNTHYNPRGTVAAEEFRFPFDDRSFTFVVLGSVFTHMLPDDVENYLSEVSRVLVAGGRCLITYFLLNTESLQFIEVGKSALNFKHPFAKYRVVSLRNPEKAIALDEEWIRDVYGKVGLDIVRTDYGSWCKRNAHLTFQDMILAFRRNLTVASMPSGRAPSISGS